MAEMIFVVPADGARIRQPERRFAVMPAEGGFVPHNSHYEALLIGGDISRGNPPAAPAPEAKPETPSNQGNGRRQRATAQED